MSHATTTDLYEASMSLSYLQEGMTDDVTFSLFVRDLPPGRGFPVSAGLEPDLDFLADFCVTPGDARDFTVALGRPPHEVEPLMGLGFEGEGRAVPEGRIDLPGEPLLEVTAPLTHAQLVETWLLSRMSHRTTVAAKSARCVLAAVGHPVVDFSLGRGHGPEAGMQTARAGALDEYPIDHLVRSGAPIDVYAIGTKVGTSSDAPYLASAYKLAEYDGRPVMNPEPPVPTRSAQPSALTSEVRNRLEQGVEERQGGFAGSVGSDLPREPQDAGCRKGPAKWKAAPANDL
ncbi:hypothetical protein ACFW9O_30355 [Streptomyces sp. NPDC059499]|uniref:hypothetical protein n=1 Tax=Streptomyces sp. NPDC059499 TaxID=3346852 RepID=UPI0036933C34